MTVLAEPLLRLSAVLAALLALAVGVSFAWAWRERGSPPAPALAVRLMLSEFACLAATLLLRPLGWLPGRPAAGPSRRPPVVLLHGLFQNRSCLFPLQWRLRSAGYDRVVTVNTPPWRCLASLVDTVAETVEQACRDSGHQRVSLVGHSMGGILARCYLQERAGAARVAACVTLGSPHSGSKLARLAVSRLGRDLLPGSGLLARLNALPLPERTAFTAIRSCHDNIIVPAESARLDGAGNIELAGLGHTALLFSAQAAAAVRAALEPNRD